MDLKPTSDTEGRRARLWGFSGIFLVISREKKVFQVFPYQGATTLNVVDPPTSCALDNYKWGHLAMTYTSVAILVILGDDLSRLDRKTIIKGELKLKFPRISLSNAGDSQEWLQFSGRMVPSALQWRVMSST
jgi:geranylgeranyl transferase type-1 subunit beta